jgi:mono/diheme cytochrome c family protein
MLFKRTPSIGILIGAQLLFPASLQAAGKSGSQAVDFRREVLPVLSANCFACHGPDEAAREAKLRLDVREEAVRERQGSFVIKPGDPRNSELVHRIRSTAPDDIMPPPKSGHHLEPGQMDLLERWIAEGAPYAEHWAFVAPVRSEVPEVTHRGSRITHPIDAFIVRELRKHSLQPSPRADRHTLIRRLSLDLTGLPPSREEVRDFVNDTRPDAYERLVDRLLASPHFGERWARLWLDLARYADSAGYGSDPLRMNIWPYRDWVIDAFNRNVPYDQFTIEQLAGDLLPDPTTGQLVATAFHRNTMTNTEGGTDDEEFRVAAVKDRVGTTMQVWMGLTMNCAQCHTHKYDPITQREYYQFYAIFNQTADTDKPTEEPTLPVPTAEQQAQMDAIHAQIAALQRQLADPPREFFNELAAWEKQQQKGIAWTVLKPAEVKSEQGTKFKVLDDGAVLATGAAPDKDTYTVRLNTDLQNITAIRLEVLTDDSLPEKGPGRSEGGNFVLNDLKLMANAHSAPAKKAQFVRVEIPGADRILSLAEVQVFSGGENVARKGKATQSSTDFDGPPHLAIDGNTDGQYREAKSTTHTKTEKDPWWEVDLGTELPVDEIVIWNRSDGGVFTRLNNFKVLALGADRKPVFQTTVREPPKHSLKLATSGVQSVALQNATATHGQPEFDVTEAVNGRSDSQKGWAVGGALGRPHVAIFEAGGKVGEAGGTELVITMRQIFGGGHTLGKFRLSATTHPKPVRVLPKEIETILALAPEKRSEAQRRKLAEHYRPFAPSLAKINQQIAAKQKELASIKPVQLPVLQEVALDKRRETRIQVRGNFLDLGEKVEQGFPAAFFNPRSSRGDEALKPHSALRTPHSAMDQSLLTSSATSGGRPTRLDAARWLVSRDNPLTARVAVNRFWAQLFGTGIVETEEDFGTQGKLPSHPELLDWLAVEFMEPSAPVTWLHGYKDTRGSRGEAADSPSCNHVTSHPCNLCREAGAWDMKRLLKLIVTSGTYQQSSVTTAGHLEKDPQARWLSRYPRRRLEAEGVRDTALALSGLLAPQLGGPSVYPPQPDGLWRAAFNGQRDYPTSKGADRYRRGIYTFWRRTVPYPSMQTFDAPSRETCSLRRLPSNTPLQAFVTLNDPAFVEMAQSLARRLMREGGATPVERARYGLELCLARPANEEQVRALVQLYEQELATYRADADAAKKLATAPLGPLPGGLDPAETAAWTVVANVLLNLDGVLTKG